MVKKISYSLAVILLGTILYAASGTPSTLRVNTDTSGNLLVAGGTLTGTTTSSVFSNTRLNTDSSGNLLVIFTGGTITGPIYNSDGTCLLPTYSFTNDTSQGLAKGCLVVKQGTITTDLQAISTTATWNAVGVVFTGWKQVITDTASAVGSLVVSIKGGVAGTTNLFSVDKNGVGSFGSNVSAVSWVGTGNAQLGTTGSFAFLNRASFTSPSDGIFTFTNYAATDFTRLQLGGTTSSFPSIKRNGANIEFRLADDSGNAGITAQNYVLGAGGGIAVVSNAFIATAPTIASGGCSSPAVTSSNGTAAFLITIGTSCSGVKTFTLTMPASSHFWSCSGDNHTSDAAQQTNYIVARATSTTAVVVTSYDRVTGLQEDFTASNTYLIHCTGE